MTEGETNLLEPAENNSPENFASLQTIDEQIEAVKLNIAGLQTKVDKASNEWNDSNAKSTKKTRKKKILDVLLPDLVVAKSELERLIEQKCVLEEVQSEASKNTEENPTSLDEENKREREYKRKIATGKGGNCLARLDQESLEEVVYNNEEFSLEQLENEKRIIEIDIQDLNFNLIGDCFDSDFEAIEVYNEMKSEDLFEEARNFIREANELKIVILEKRLSAVNKAIKEKKDGPVSDVVDLPNVNVGEVEQDETDEITNNKKKNIFGRVSSGLVGIFRRKKNEPAGGAELGSGEGESETVADEPTITPDMTEPENMPAGEAMAEEEISIEGPEYEKFKVARENFIKFKKEFSILKNQKKDTFESKSSYLVAIGNARLALEKAEKIYYTAKLVLVNELFAQKKDELTASGLGKADIELKLKEFKTGFLLKKLVIEDILELQKLELENLPEKDKNLFGKAMAGFGKGLYTVAKPVLWGLEKYSKIERKKRVILTALGITGLAVTTGAVSLSAAGGYLGYRLARGLAGLFGGMAFAEGAQKALDNEAGRREVNKRKGLEKIIDSNDLDEQLLVKLDAQFRKDESELKSMADRRKYMKAMAAFIGGYGSSMAIGALYERVNIPQENSSQKKSDRLPESKTEIKISANATQPISAVADNHNSGTEVKVKPGMTATESINPATSSETWHSGDSHLRSEILHKDLGAEKHELTIQKGSFEGSLIHYLMHEKGMSFEKAGVEAHEITQKFIASQADANNPSVKDSYSRIGQGYKIVIEDHDGKVIIKDAIGKSDVAPGNEPPAEITSNNIQETDKPVTDVDDAKKLMKVWHDIADSSDIKNGDYELSTDNANPEEEFKFHLDHDVEVDRSEVLNDAPVHVPSWAEVIEKELDELFKGKTTPFSPGESGLAGKFWEKHINSLTPSTKDYLGKIESARAMNFINTINQYENSTGYNIVSQPDMDKFIENYKTMPRIFADNSNLEMEYLKIFHSPAGPQAGESFKSILDFKDNTTGVVELRPNGSAVLKDFSHNGGEKFDVVIKDGKIGAVGPELRDEHIEDVTRMGIKNGEPILEINIENLSKIKSLIKNFDMNTLESRYYN